MPGVVIVEDSNPIPYTKPSELLVKLSGLPTAPIMTPSGIQVHKLFLVRVSKEAAKAELHSASKPSIQKLLGRSMRIPEDPITFPVASISMGGSLALVNLPESMTTWTKVLIQAEKDTGFCPWPARISAQQVGVQGGKPLLNVVIHDQSEDLWKFLHRVFEILREAGIAFGTDFRAHGERGPVGATP